MESCFSSPDTSIHELNEDLDKVLNRKNGFRHTSIDAHSEVRLLHISQADWEHQATYTLEVISLRQLATTTYNALSYTWGDVPTIDTLHAVEIDGQKYFVRQNLHDFLVTASDRRINGLFFIDAICIDQLSETENQDQIPAMARIFRNAARVIGWLGMPEQGHLEDIRALAGTTSKSAASWSASEWAGFTYLSYHPYWRRLWIVQEVLLASSMTIWCGPFTFPLSLFTATSSCSTWGTGIDIHGRPTTVPNDVARLHSPAQVVITHRTRQVLRPIYDPIAQGVNVGMIGEMTQMLRKPYLAVKSYQSQIPDRLYDAIPKFGNFNCKDKRDRLYGLMGILDERTQAKIKPDYTRGVDYAYRQALQFGLQELFQERIATAVAQTHQPRNRAYLRYYCDVRDAFEMTDTQSISILHEILPEVLSQMSGPRPTYQNQWTSIDWDDNLCSELKEAFAFANESMPKSGGWLTDFHHKQHHAAHKLLNWARQKFERRKTTSHGRYVQIRPASDSQLASSRV